MGRLRSKHFDLPPKVRRKGARYYYVTLDQGCSLWVPLGLDKDAAFAKAAEYRAGKLVESAPKRNLRQEVMLRDGFRCVYCGATSNLCVDHVVPLSRGGANVGANVVVACTSCNSKKRGQHPRVFGDQLAKIGDRLK